MMLPCLRRMFGFNLQLGQRDRLRQGFRPRLEFLEDRLAPAITVMPAADQMSTEGAPNSFALGSFSDSDPLDTVWRVDVNWGDPFAHTTFGASNQGDLGMKPHTY